MLIRLLPLSFLLPLFTLNALVDAQSSSDSPSSSVSSSASSSSASSTSEASPTSTGSPSPSGIQSLISGLQTAGFFEFANALNRVNQTTSGQQLVAQLANGSYTVFAPSDQAFKNASSTSQPNINDPETLAAVVAYHFVNGDLTNSSYTNSSAGAAGGGGSSSSSTASTSASSQSQSSSSSSASSSASVSSSGGGGGGESSTSTVTATPSSSAASYFWVFNRQSTSTGSSNSSSSPQIQSSIYPNTTAGRTLLNNETWVQLEGNKSQALVWTRPWVDGNVTILNQSSNITIVNTTTVSNYFINGINGVLIPPGNITTALAAINATSFQNLAYSVQTQMPNGTNGTFIDAVANLTGFTLLLPSNDGLSGSAQSTIQGLRNNQTALTAFLKNHVVNGTTLYSPILCGSSNSSANSSLGATTYYTSASGESLAFTANATGLFVADANGTSAKIVRPDVLVSNGVIQIIDRPLIELASRPAAASSAASSASASASSARTSSETGIIGGGITSGRTTRTTQPSSSSASSSSSPSAASSSASSSQSQSSSSSSASSASSTSSASSATPSATLATQVLKSNAMASMSPLGVAFTLGLALGIATWLMA